MQEIKEIGHKFWNACVVNNQREIKKILSVTRENEVINFKVSLFEFCKCKFWIITKNYDQCIILFFSHFDNNSSCEVSHYLGRMLFKFKLINLSLTLLTFDMWNIDKEYWFSLWKLGVCYLIDNSFIYLFLILLLFCVSSKLLKSLYIYYLLQLFIYYFILWFISHVRTYVIWLNNLIK